MKKSGNKLEIIIAFGGKHSGFGHLMHSVSYRSLRVNYLYWPLIVTDCRGPIQVMRALGLRGAVISMPLKQEALRFVDKIDPIAKKIGAINTIVNNQGKLIGYNTDYLGAMKALKLAGLIKNKTVVMLGAGGVARAIGYGLQQEGAKIIVLNRTASKGRELARTLGAKYYGDLPCLGSLGHFDILINATSIGFKQSKSPVTNDLIPRKITVMDVVADPYPTALLKLAKAKGCKIVPGYKMMIYQAREQIKMFTGKEPPFGIMEKEILKYLKRH
ncbi:MAG: shikimate dehydrogenase [Candidatus Komeilibacteria bacterium]